MIASTILFYALAAIIILGAVYVLFAANLVRALFALFGILVAVAGIFFLLGAQVAGAAQLLVYAGGILVLMIFGLMSTQPADGQFQISRWNITSSLLLSGSLAALFMYLALHFDVGGQPVPAASYLGGRPAAAGQTLVLLYALPFEASAILLLLSLVFASVLIHRSLQVPKATSAPTISSTKSQKDE